MISAQEALEILNGAEQICPAEEVAATVKRMAGEIGASLGEVASAGVECDGRGGGV